MLRVSKTTGSFPKGIWMRGITTDELELTWLDFSEQTGGAGSWRAGCSPGMNRRTGLRTKSMSGKNTNWESGLMANAAGGTYYFVFMQVLSASE